MVFPDGGPQPRHPSQLYEAALEGIVLFCLLRWATHRRHWLNRRGVVMGLFLAGYGLIRISLENVREPDSYMPNFPLGLTMGMMLSAPMVLIGAWLVWRGLKEPLPPLLATEEAHLAPPGSAKDADAPA
jgi:phosphatidylglycerol:prolipoprotein diacylglycerol transferase